MPDSDHDYQQLPGAPEEQAMQDSKNGSPAAPGQQVIRDTHNSITHPSVGEVVEFCLTPMGSPGCIGLAGAGAAIGQATADEPLLGCLAGTGVSIVACVAGITWNFFSSRQAATHLANAVGAGLQEDNGGEARPVIRSGSH